MTEAPWATVAPFKEQPAGCGDGGGGVGPAGTGDGVREELAAGATAGEARTGAGLDVPPPPLPPPPVEGDAAVGLARPDDAPEGRDDPEMMATLVLGPTAPKPVDADVPLETMFCVRWKAWTAC